MSPSPRHAVLALVVLLTAVGGCIGGGGSPAASAGPTATTTIPTDVASPSSAGTPTPGLTPTPVPSPSHTARPTASPTAPPTATPQPFLSYAVVAGDTLGRIASRFDTTWQSLVFWNLDAYPSLDPDDRAYDPNRLQVGWVLHLLPGVVVPFDAPLPTIPPTPEPTAPPTSGAATGALVTNGSRQTNRVALTFDMGGRVGDALGIMTWLRDHGVPATIFITGAMAESTATDAGRQVLARIDARTDLFDLGNHSYSHPRMTTLTAAGMASEIQRAEAAIDRYAATSPRPFFRPPEGDWNSTLVTAAASVGYRFTVMWDVDTIDWKPTTQEGPTAQQIVDKVLGRAQAGSIVLMHLGGYETLEALPAIVSGLRARGLQMVTLGTMLGG